MGDRVQPQCPAGTGTLEVQVPYRYRCHAGTSAKRYRCHAATAVMQVRLPYRYRRLRGKGALQLQVPRSHSVLQVQVPYRYRCLTGTGAIEVHMPCRYKCLAGTGAIQVQVPCRYRCHVGTGAIQLQVPYRYRCHTGTGVLQVRHPMQLESALQLTVQIKPNQVSSATPAPCAVVLLQVTEQHNFAFWLYECVSCCITVDFWDCTCEWVKCGCSVLFCVLTVLGCAVLKKCSSCWPRNMNWLYRLVCLQLYCTKNIVTATCAGHSFLSVCLSVCLWLTYYQRLNLVGFSWNSVGQLFAEYGSIVSFL